MSAADVHIFSLQEARETLPLIRPIVEDVLACQRKLNKLLKENRVAHYENKGDGEPIVSSSNDQVIANYRQNLTEYVHELYDLGAEIHEFDRGRVDFPTELDHRVVYLCWESQDDDISHWHETYASCLKRKPIEGVGFDEQ